MFRLLILILIFGTACVFTSSVQAADSLRTDSISASNSPDLRLGAARSDTVFVIPAGPVAGTFTPASRVTVADTIAGWAKIQIEGWVPVAKVADRLNAPPNPFQAASIAEKPAKQKPPARQCEAVTKKGVRCTRNAVKGTRYCWQHTPR